MRTAAKSPQMTADGLPASEQGNATPLAAMAPTALPSANLKHATVLRAELENRLSQFVSGIAALQAELDGQMTKHEAELAEINLKHEDRLSEMDQKHQSSKANLLDRIEDLKGGQMMLTRALDAGDQE